MMMNEDGVEGVAMEVQSVGGFHSHDAASTAELI